MNTDDNKPQDPKPTTPHDSTTPPKINVRNTIKKAGGRPSKLTPQVHAAIVSNIKMCMPFELACRSAGISYHAFREWMIRGEEDRKGGKFRKLVDDVHAAEATALSGCLATIVSAVSANKNWKAAAWILERRHSEFFSRQRLDVNLGAQPGTFEALVQRLLEMDAEKGGEGGGTPAPDAPREGAIDTPVDDEKPMSAE